MLLMDYPISGGWLIALVFIPFLFGLLLGIKNTRARIMLKLLKKLDENEIKKLLDDKV
jgi:hypothetical protein